jgi:hypothetical protein
MSKIRRILTTDARAERVVARKTHRTRGARANANPARLALPSVANQNQKFPYQSIFGGGVWGEPLRTIYFIKRNLRNISRLMSENLTPRVVQNSSLFRQVNNRLFSIQNSFNISLVYLSAIYQVFNFCNLFSIDFRNYSGY